MDFNEDTSLTITEETRLAELEAVIEHGLKTFVDVGNALLEVRDSRLYRKEYSTFEDYCRDRWGMSKRYANYQIEAARTIGNLGTIVPTLPATESQARPLTSLPPEVQAEAWQRAVETAPDGKITAAHVQSVVDDYKEEMFPINRCEVCGHLYSNELPSCPYCDKFKGMEVIEVERKPHVSNNSGNNEWYTPAEYIDAARYVMGSIDLDPASSDVANQTVKAITYYTIENDGLQHKWFGRVWMNPPYASGFVDKFTEKLTMHYTDGDVEEAIVLVNNATETTWFQQMANVCKGICFPRRRVKFIDVDGNPSGAPLQGQAILYMGSNIDEFANVFGKFGFVLYA